MTEKLDKIVQEAEVLMKEADEKLAQGSYFAAFARGIKVLYLQNKAIIEMLKDYKK
jgi:hypothetical protein